MSVSQKLSKIVSNQFPSFYKEEGPKFIAFMEAYYEYMEQQGKMTDAVKNLESYRDISETTDEFIQYFINTFLPSVPFDIVGNKKLMVKYINEFNRSRGTIAAYKLLFRALYNESIEINYPSEQILKVSDSDWRKDRYLITDYDPATYKFIGKTIVGVESAAEALVEDIIRLNVRGRDILQIILSNIAGEFNNSEPIKLLSDNSASPHAPVVEAGITEVEIISPGGEYRVGDTVDMISSFKGDQGQVVVSETQDLGGVIAFDVDKGGSGYTSTTNGTTSLKITGGDGTSPASFIIADDDIVDRFAIAINTDLLSSNNIFGKFGAPITRPVLSHSPIQGTVTTTHANNTMVGVGTSFTTDLQVGDDLYFNNQFKQRTYLGKVFSVANNDTVSLNAASLSSATQLSNVKLSYTRDKTLSMSTFANTVLSAMDYGFREKGQELNNTPYRDQSDAILMISNTTSDPLPAWTSANSIFATDAFGVPTGANATVRSIIRSYSNNNLVVRVDGYKKWNTNDRIRLNFANSTGTEVGTVVNYQSNNVGWHPISIGVISGLEPVVGDVLTGANTGAVAVVTHRGTTNGHYGSSLTIANTTASVMDIQTGDILNGQTSGTNATVNFVDSSYNGSQVGLSIRSFGNFTNGEKINLVDYGVANNRTIGTVDSFTVGGRDVLTYRISGVSTANATSQFDFGPNKSFEADEGVYVNGTIVGNVAYTTSNTQVENIHTKLKDALNFKATTFGTISKLSLPVGGAGYSIPPKVEVRENDIAALGIGEAYITLQSANNDWGTGTPNFKLDANDKLHQSNTGATGNIKEGAAPNQPIQVTTHANGVYEMTVRVWQDFLQRKPGNINWSNNSYVDFHLYDRDYVQGLGDRRVKVGTGVGKIVKVDDRGVLGNNAVISASIGANGTITKVRVLDSGFCYQDKEIVILETPKRNRASSATLKLSLKDVGNSAGYYSSSRSHLDTVRAFIQDSNYYQEYSYEVVSPVSLDRYREYALKLVHPAGQKLFGQFKTQSNADITVTANTSYKRRLAGNGTISIVKTPATGTVSLTSNTTDSLFVSGSNTNFENEFVGQKHFKYHIQRATAEAFLSGTGVGSINVRSNGTQFANATVTINPPFGNSKAWQNGLVVTYGDYVDYNDNFYYVDHGGTLNNTPPTHTTGRVTFPVASLKYVGTQATATATVTGGQVSSISVVNSGSGYVTAPSVTVSNPNDTVITGTDDYANTLLIKNESSRYVVYNNNTFLVNGTDYTANSDSAVYLTQMPEPGDTVHVYVEGSDIIIETSHNEFHLLNVKKVNSSSNLQLTQSWYGANTTSANIYFANAHTITGTSTTFNNEFANGDVMIIDNGDNNFIEVQLNSVISNTSANLNIVWTSEDITSNNIVYISGSL